MKTNSALQTIYSFFLGLAVVAFFGVGLATFHPSPHQPDNMDWEKYQPLYEQWMIYTSGALLGFAILVLVIALFWAEKITVLANGLLLGGLFTLFYAVILTLDSGRSVFRFVMVALALVVALAVGWYRFAWKRTAKQESPTVGSRELTATDTSPLGPDLEQLNARVEHLERRLDAAGQALGAAGKKDSP